MPEPTASNSNNFTLPSGLIKIFGVINKNKFQSKRQFKIFIQAEKLGIYKQKKKISNAVGI